MKKIYLLFAICATVLAASCTKEELEQKDDNKIEVALVPMEFTSSIETKTALDGDEGAVKWNNNDKISLFAETYAGNNEFTTDGRGTFTGTAAPEATNYYALYPYCSEAVFDTENNTIATKLLPDQNAAIGTFADNIAIMAAKTGNKSLSFKNLCSHIKFTLPEGFEKGVKSITLMGNESEVLCGTFKISWADGKPSISVTDPETYVTLRNSDKSLLSAGDYYFTVLPVSFANGFTVILSFEDGTQKAVKTTKNITTVSGRNQILRMAALDASKFSDHMNYFVKYNDGFDLTFGDVTINKTSESYSNGKLVNDNKKNTTINTDGLYFINTQTSAKVTYNAAKSLILIGVDKATRSTLGMTKQTQPQDGGTLILYANVNITTENRPIAQSNNAAYSSFGSIIFSNCHLIITNDNLCRLQLGSSTTESIIIEDSEICCNKASMFIINYGSTAFSEKSTLNKMIIKNNVFYAGDAVMTDFKLVNGKTNLILGEFEVSNNTFHKTITKNTGVITADTFNGYATVSNNYFVEIHPAASTVIYLVNPNTVTDQSNRTISNNYIYSSLESARNMTFNKELFKNAEDKYPQMPRLLDANPLNDLWKPANGVFGSYKAVTYNNATGTVPSGVGAQRPDMTASATANEAGYQYPSVDLGTF